MSEHDEESGGAPMQHGEHAEHDFTGPLTPGVKRFIQVLLAISGVLLALDFVVDRKIHQPAEKLPGFYAIYGFVGCVVLVLAARELRKLVMRPEDYYDPPAEPGGDDANDPKGAGGDD